MFTDILSPTVSRTPISIDLEDSALILWNCRTHQRLTLSSFIFFFFLAN